MNLRDLIDQQNIHLDKKFESTDDLLKYAATCFSIRTSIPADVIHKQLQYRESLGGTCIGDGVFIPHTRIEGIDDILIEIIRVHPLSHVSCNESGGHIQYVFSILSSKNVATEYLLVLKAIVELITNFRDNLDNARNEEDFIAALQQSGIKVGTFLVAGDLFSTAISIKADDSISLAVDIMKKNHVEQLAVVNDSGMFLGSVDFIDLLKSAFPSYAFNFEDLSFLGEFEPLKEFLAHETKGIVKDYITNDRSIHVDAEDSYVEIVHKFVRNHLHYVFVLKNDHLLGIITSSDLITKLLRA